MRTTGEEVAVKVQRPDALSTISKVSKILLSDVAAWHGMAAHDKAHPWLILQYWLYCALSVVLAQQCACMGLCVGLRSLCMPAGPVCDAASCGDL